MSNIPLEKIQNNILDLEIKLFGISYAIYCVDYTQDYSGTMQRCKLINYFLENLPFRMQGCDGAIDAEYTIFDSVQSVGRNVLSFIHENRKTKNLHRVKLYNKIVSNFEAGEVRSCMGGIWRIMYILPTKDYGKYSKRKKYNKEDLQGWKYLYTETNKILQNEPVTK